MKLTVDRDDLSAALHQVRLAEAGVTLLHGSILIDVSKRWLTLTGMSSTVTVKVARAIKDGEPQRFLVRPEIAQAISALPVGWVDLELDPTWLRVKSEHGPSFKFRIGDADSMPRLKFGTTQFVMPVAVLRRVADYIAAIKPENVVMLSEEGRVVFVATDNYRLAKVNTDIEFEIEEEVLVPAITFGLISKVLTADEEVGVSIDPNRVTFRQGTEVLLSGQRSAMKVPAFKKVVDALVVSSNFVVKKDDLLAACNRASTITAGYLPMKVALGEEFEISTSRSDVGDSKELLTDGVWDGDEFNIAVNVRYLQDILHSLRGEKVTFGFDKPTTMFQITGSDDPMAQFIVMPIRT